MKTRLHCSPTRSLLLPALLFACFLILGTRASFGIAELFTGPNGQHLTSRGWTAYANAGSGPITVSSNMAQLSATNSEADSRPFGNYAGDRIVDRYLYYKFTAQVTAPPTSATTGDYFMALRNSSDGSVRGVVWIKRLTSTTARIGISYRDTDTPVYPLVTLSLNTPTQFVVMLDRGNGTTMPSATITVDPSGLNKSGTSTSSSDETFTPDTIALRQSNNNGGIGNLLVDEVLTGTMWNDVFGPIFDVTSSSFGATGATPSSSTIDDDEPGIQAAIWSSGTSHKHGIVVFPPGRYDVTGDHFSTASGGTTAFYLLNATDLTIQGNGAAIMMRSSTNSTTAACIPLLASAFYISTCTNTVVRDLSIDWKRPPFTVMTVGNVTTGTSGTHWTITGTTDTSVFPMPALSSTGTTVIGDKDPLWHVESVIDWEPTLGLPLSNISFYDKNDSNISTSYDIPSNTWTVDLNYSGSVSTIKTHLTNAMAALSGTSLSTARKLILRHKTGQYTAIGGTTPDLYNHNCINISLGSNTQFYDVTINASCGMAMHSTQTTDVRLTRVKVQPSSTARLMSSLVDGTFFTFCKGTITLDNCYYKNTGDDSANVNAKFMVVEAINGTTISVIPAAGDAGPAGVVNEVYEFMTYDAHSLIAPVPPFTSHYLTGTAAPNGNVAGTGVAGWDLPFNDVTNLNVGDFVVSTAWSPALDVINGTTFDGSQARGLIVSTRNVIVDSSTFQNPAFNGIMVIASTHNSGAQGPGAQSGTFTNNTFQSCGAAPIAFIAHSGSTPSRPAAVGMFRDFHIEDNTFLRNKPGITPKINDLRLTRCTIGGTNADLPTAYFQSAILVNSLDVINSSTNSISYNTFVNTGGTAAPDFNPVIYFNHVATGMNVTSNLSSGMQWQMSGSCSTPVVTGTSGCLLQTDQNPVTPADNDLIGYDQQMGDIR